jgi:hypothetical protein
MKIITRLLVADDIEIFGKDIPEDKRAAGYNIGDLLNMPHLAGCWYANPHNSIEQLKRLYIVGESYKGSILHFYIQKRPNTETIPFIPRVIGATKMYINNNKCDVFKEVCELVQDIDNICVHVRSGDKFVEPEFIDLIAKISKKYKNVYLLSGVHKDEFFEKNDVKINNFLNSINNILVQNGNIHIILGEPDEHLGIMYSAKNLLLHKGGFSVLGSIVNQGNLFLTPLLTTIECVKWKNMVNRSYVIFNLKPLPIDNT